MKKVSRRDFMNKAAMGLGSAFIFSRLSVIRRQIDVKNASDRFSNLSIKGFDWQGF